MERRIGPDGPEGRAMSLSGGYPANALGTIVIADTKEASEKLYEVGQYLEDAGLVAAQRCQPFAGQIARVQIDAFGESAAEVESTLLEYATRCDAAAQASETNYGRCVIERNLEEEWGATYSWRGRLTLTPTIGTIASSERAAATIT